MKLCRKRGDSRDLSRSSYTESFYYACCFVVPTATGLLALIVDILYCSASLIVLQAISVIVVVGFILFLSKSGKYAEDAEFQIKKARAKILAANDSETAFKFGRMPAPDASLVKTYYFANTGSIQKVKYCYTCKKFKPPLTVHCSKCRECCLQFDHHCSWLKTCIGKSNYAQFITFLVSLFAEGILVFLTAMFGWTNVGDHRMAGYVLLGIAYFGSCLITGFSLLLLLFHMFLLIKGKTTYQYIKGRFRQQVYNQAVIQSKCSELEDVVGQQGSPGGRKGGENIEDASPRNSESF